MVVLCRRERCLLPWVSTNVVIPNRTEGENGYAKEKRKAGVVWSRRKGWLVARELVHALTPQVVAWG